MTEAQVTEAQVTEAQVTEAQVTEAQVTEARDRGHVIKHACSIPREPDAQL
ncbi:hypothetical protein [Frankia sp. Cr2]|uniref:hypothetical protein n=1 Tax=Frankia sp. Cr2 TaxID=3073932 RepID=UPI002AD430B3|nr:hypothetical protein [Frankia sp. Cr2]